MRPEPNLRIEQYRKVHPTLGGSEPGENVGYFEIILGSLKGYDVLRVICGDGYGWDHVSVSLADRCPTWKEMCLVKELWFKDEECVVQYHPPKAEHINCHQYCLHLWRKQDGDFPMPDTIMIA